MPTRTRVVGQTAVLILAAAVAVASAGCGARLPANARSASHSTQSPAPAASTPGAGRKPIWLKTLTMVSARTGWAIAWSGSPDARSGATMRLVRTTDGGRTWAGVTPMAAGPLLASQNSYAVSYASSAASAWLAVTRQHSNTDSDQTPELTKVFATTDGGRTWQASALIRAPGSAGWISVAGPSDRWLLQNLGAAMGQDGVQLYRSTDAGRQWRLIARTPVLPQAGTSASGLPTACDKTGLTFATPTTGFLTGICHGTANLVLTSTDGGAHWHQAALPIPAAVCSQSTCDAQPPRFFGRAGFLTVGSDPGPGFLLTSHDTGATWQSLALPPGAGPYPQITFFDARHGVLIPEGPQQSFGQVIYETSDGGLHWRPIRQAAAVGQFTAIEFVTPGVGFAQNANSKSPALYTTSDAGRTWTRFIPLS